MLKQSISRDLNGFFFIPLIHFLVFVTFFQECFENCCIVLVQCACVMFFACTNHMFVLKGNKGAVGVSFMFNGTSFGFVNCHLTSGNEKITRYSSLNLHNT